MSYGDLYQRRSTDFGVFREGREIEGSETAGKGFSRLTDLYEIHIQYLGKTDL